MPPDQRDTRFLATGDNICLYCIDTKGYVFCDRTSSSQNVLYVYSGQDQEAPNNVPNPQVITFQVHIQNRYKLAKKYRRMRDEHDAGRLGADGPALLEQAKSAALAEYQDNIFEQKRLHGKPVRYGDRIQLLHIYTNKYIHVDNTRTSSHDKSCLVVHLLSYDAKAAQFRVLPKYKVNSEGEEVRVGDQVIFESVKTPGQHFSASKPFALGVRGQCSEFNLGVDASEFTVLRRFWAPKPDHEHETLWGNGYMLKFPQGGAIVQLYHKHLEAYLCAEGIFVEGPSENVHLRIREVDQQEPRTLHPPSSCHTLWQLEADHSIVDGNPLRWEQRVRLRHLPTRMYLAVDQNNPEQVHLVDGPPSSNTVFRLHPKNDETGEITSTSCARIEHVMSGTWLHGAKDADFHRKKQAWLSGECKQVAVSAEPLYMDAFYIRLVQWPLISDYNFISGMVPLFSDIATQTNAEWGNIDDRFQSLLMALNEVDGFLKEQPSFHQNRRKLLRELKVLDLLVALLQSSSQWPAKNEQKRLFETIYEIFYTCITLGDNHDSLYLAQYLDLFLSQIKLKEGFGFYVTRVLVELIRDRREVVERITQRQIDSFIGLLKKYEHHRYTQLLSALCVVDGMALPANQSRICDRLIQKNKGSLLCFHLHNGNVMVSNSKHSSVADVALHLIVNNRRSSKDDRAFLQEQLVLFQRLCHGRNQHCIDTITRETETVSWDVAMGVLRSTDITDDIKAMFCDLIICLFIDVGENTSLSVVMTNTYVYDSLATDEPMSAWINRQFKYVEPELEERLPELTDWITNFLRTNQYMVAEDAARNKLIFSTVRIVRALFSFGYMRDGDIALWRPFLMNLIDGSNDVPSLPVKKGIFRASRHWKQPNLINFRNFKRYERDPDSTAMVDAKFQVLEVLDVLLTTAFHLRVARVAAWFRDVIKSDKNVKVKQKGALCELLKEDFKPSRTFWRVWDPLDEASATIDHILEDTEPIAKEALLQGLMDLTRYKCPAMTLKGLAILQRHFTERNQVLRAAKEAKLLTTRESLYLFRTVQTFMPLLHRLLAVKLYENQMHLVSAVIDRFKDCCRVSHDSTKPHYIGQHILVAHGILPMALSILDRQSTSSDESASSAELSLVSSTLQLLELMTRSNPDVQRELFKHLHILLKVTLAPVQLAETLKELFDNNVYGAWRIESNHIKVLIQLVAKHKERAPGFVQVLSKLIVVDDQGSMLRRNQSLVMKHLLQNYPDDAYVFELPASRRRKILLREEGHAILEYFIHLLNLLVHCGQDTRGSIRCFCQNVLPAREIVSLLAHSEINNNLKRPLVKYFSCIYLQSATVSDQKIASILHSSEMWTFLGLLSDDLEFCLSELTASGLESAPGLENLDPCYCPNSKNSMDGLMCTFFYLTDSIIDFLLEFTRLYGDDIDQFPDEKGVIRKLATSLMLLSPSLTGMTRHVTRYRAMRTAVQRLMTSAEFSPQDIEVVLNEMEANANIQPKRNSGQTVSDVEVELSEEVCLNRKLGTFISNTEKTMTKTDTVKDQLDINDSKLRNRAYRFGMTGANLPLDGGFQHEVAMFVNKGLKLISQHYAKTEILLRHLRMSASNMSPPGTEGSELVDIRCLQIIRATLHNHIVLLPDNWKGKTAQKVRSRLKTIRELQNYYVSQGIVDITFSLLNKQREDILLEVLALLCCLLFNANRGVQDAALKYFGSTKEEVFFMVLTKQFQIATTVIKEWRSIQVLRQKQAGLLTRSSSGSDVISNSGHEEGTSAEGEETERELVKSYDDGAIMLMLAVLATLCDGQHRGMQDYLRYQPDNLRSFNVVAEATHFLALLCSNISSKNMELVTQTFNTLTEICQGNQENRVVTLNSKVVDYINTIIRSDTFSNCDNMQVLTLYRALADFLYSIVEESSPDALRVAKEVASTIDEQALLRILNFCYDVHHERAWPVLSRLRLRRSNKVSTTDLPRQMSAQDVAFVKRTAIKYYIIIARLRDVTPHPDHDEGVVSRPLASYRRSVASVEIIKNGHLQKIYFPLPAKCHIRRELKERLLWNIDRTSPTNKIRDFMRWSKVILADVLYSRKVLANPITMFISSQWMLWNYAIIALSVVINVIMLATWEAKLSMKDVPSTVITLPPNIDEPIPQYPLLPNFMTVLLILGGIHNGVAVLLLLSFFLIHNPSAPKLYWLKDIVRWFKRYKRRDNERYSDGRRESHAEMDEGIFTLKALFYLGLVAASFAGTLTHGYFFAFHLLNIVNTNELLKGVIKAVTLNGRSLIWVAILGLVFLYLYALIGFAFFRASFEPQNQLYCDTLYECSVTIIRYGMIGDIDENLRIHPLANNFRTFGYLVMYQVTFFIFFTTIGLNIIFGIIVDTFSELRDLKWRAEKDMQETCFVCSRQSYDFEHYSNGFTNHIRKEHNMWTYIQYFLYLSDTNPIDYSALDYYVSARMKEDRYDFFPLNRALALSNMDDEVDESKLDNIAVDVRFLVQKYKEEEDKHRVKMDRHQHERWKEDRLVEAGVLTPRATPTTSQRRHIRRVSALGLPVDPDLPSGDGQRVDAASLRALAAAGAFRSSISSVSAAQRDPTGQATELSRVGESGELPRAAESGEIPPVAESGELPPVAESGGEHVDPTEESNKMGAEP